MNKLPEIGMEVEYLGISEKAGSQGRFFHNYYLPPIGWRGRIISTDRHCIRIDNWFPGKGVPPDWLWFGYFKLVK